MAELINRDLLHRFWWDRCDKKGLIEINQTTMAENLGVTRRTMTNTMRKMEAEGRIEQFERQKQGRCIWQIFDPDNHMAPKKPEVEGQKKIRWG